MILGFVSNYFGMVLAKRFLKSGFLAKILPKRNRLGHLSLFIAASLYGFIFGSQKVLLVLKWKKVDHLVWRPFVFFLVSISLGTVYGFFFVHALFFRPADPAERTKICFFLSSVVCVGLFFVFSGDALGWYFHLSGVFFVIGSFLAVISVSELSMWFRSNAEGSNSVRVCGVALFFVLNILALFLFSQATRAGTETQRFSVYGSCAACLLLQMSIGTEWIQEKFGSLSPLEGAFFTLHLSVLLFSLCGYHERDESPFFYWVAYVGQAIFVLLTIFAMCIYEPNHPEEALGEELSGAKEEGKKEYVYGKREAIVFYFFLLCEGLAMFGVMVGWSFPVYGDKEAPWWFFGLGGKNTKVLCFERVSVYLLCSVFSSVLAQTLLFFC
ncbi:MAG: uncharacterized protein A8A55_0736 [Amphiamblys sp. WSBS2006]|nr:MAG: uncharacterized protein A8A55_0736 [Amphiamblys sp. WSBS2006]